MLLDNSTKIPILDVWQLQNLHLTLITEKKALTWLFTKHFGYDENNFVEDNSS